MAALSRPSVLWGIPLALVTQGGEYLLDRATSRVYDVPRGSGWPKPLGRIAGGRLRTPVPSANFLERLYTHLRTQRQRLDVRTPTCTRTAPLLLMLCIFFRTATAAIVR